MRLTDAAVAALTVPKGKSEIIAFDDLFPGFRVRVARATASAIFLNTRSTALIAATPSRNHVKLASYAQIPVALTNSLVYTA